MLHTKVMPWPRSDRGFILWLFALAFVMVGAVSYILTDPPDAADQSLVIPFRVLHVAPYIWGGLFIACGLFAAATSYSDRQKSGYTALTMLTAWWSLCFLAGVPLNLIGHSSPDSIRGLGGFVVYGLFALILFRVSGLREPTP